MKKAFLFLLIVALMPACKKKVATNKFADNEKFSAIANLQDRRSTDSLYTYFTDEDAAVRKSAVMAFASIQDSLAIKKLGEVLLADKDSVVRKAAAFALGQTKSSTTE